MIVEPEDVDWQSLDLVSLLAYSRDGVPQAAEEVARRLSIP